MSGHERYFVQLVGAAVCVECSDRCGFSVAWELAEAARHSRLAILTPPAADTLEERKP